MKKIVEKTKVKGCAVFLVLFWVSSPLLSQNSIDFLNESSADFKKRMDWFAEAKFGMFIHFGLYSHHEGVYKGQKTERYTEWARADLEIPSEEYAKLADLWNPENFNADKIVRLAKKAGMKYVVITTKHHEGFCLWDSGYTEFDIASTPVKNRDLIQELAVACKKHNVRFGTYYSIIDWHHPSQFPNQNTEKEWDKWGQVNIHPERKQEYLQYLKNQVKELIVNYDTDIMWFDGDWVDWWTLDDGKDLYQYIRELKPDIIINNRVAKRNEFKKDFGTPEQRHPKMGPDHYWEACYTMNKSFGYKSYDNNWKSPEEVFKILTDINSKGGNLLLNIGPDKKGDVPKESVKILKRIGRFNKGTRTN